MIYDSVCPTFHPAAQVRNGLGGELRRSHLAAMPICELDSIIGHGRRRKQAHGEHHDWIGIRRGRCPGCGKTFTFLPPLSLPSTHYSLLTRCQALRRRFVEHCSWDREYVLLRFVQLFRHLSFRQSLAYLVKPATSRHPENGQRWPLKPVTRPLRSP